MKRIAWVLIACVLLATMLGGCAGNDEGKTAPPVDDESVKATGEATDDATKADAYPGNKLQTDAERESLAIAESDEGRLWASGDYQNGPAVEGEARLVGYTFRIHDGATQYQVRVMNGKIYGYVGGASDTALAAPYDAGWYTNPAPETDRQKEAWELALAEVAKVNPNATQGGLDGYIFLFPATEDGWFPEVIIYANREVGDFAMGGSWFE